MKIFVRQFHSLRIQFEIGTSYVDRENNKQKKCMVHKTNH